MRKKTVRDIDVNGKRVLVRVDYNVPLDAMTRQQIVRYLGSKYGIGVS